MNQAAAKIVKAACSTCGGTRNHAVLAAEKTSEHDPQMGFYSTTEYEIVRCQGCETVRFRTAYLDSDSRDYETGDYVAEVHVYPDATPKARPANKELTGLPPTVAGMYREALAAFNAGAKVLAGGGLRAIVEAICKDRKIADGNLQKKIDKLVEAGLLAKPQADLLHEERF